MKSFIFGGVLALISYLFVELLAFSAYTFKFGEYKLYDIQHSKLDAVENINTGGVYIPKNEESGEVWTKPILHPYVGFSIDGKRRRADCESDVVEDCYDRIKTYTDNPLEKRADKKLIIAILGGSFADSIGRESGQRAIIDTFRKTAQYRDYEFVFYNLGAGSFKQPQQLTRLAYYYSLGAEFDIVINIDGFNELGTTFNNYRDRNVHPAFPVFWNNRVASSMNQTFLDLYAEKKQIQQSHAAFAKFWLVEGIRYSPFMNFIWRIINQNFAVKLAEIEQQIAVSGETRKRDFAYEASGPDYHFTDWDQFHRDVADIWANSSIAMSAMVEGQGGKYYHFLQPNQYIEGNKILSDWESKYAILTKSSYGIIYRLGYPAIVEKAAKLHGNQVKYHDFTFVFKGMADTLYIDNCCHINNKGIDIFSREMSKTILNDLQGG